MLVTTMDVMRVDCAYRLGNRAWRRRPDGTRRRGSRRTLRRLVAAGDRADQHAIDAMWTWVLLATGHLLPLRVLASQGAPRGGAWLGSTAGPSEMGTRQFADHLAGCGDWAGLWWLAQQLSIDDLLSVVPAIGRLRPAQPCTARAPRLARCRPACGPGPVHLDDAVIVARHRDVGHADGSAGWAMVDRCTDGRIAALDEFAGTVHALAAHPDGFVVLAVGTHDATRRTQRFHGHDGGLSRSVLLDADLGLRADRVVNLVVEPDGARMAVAGAGLSIVDRSGSRVLAGVDDVEATEPDMLCIAGSSRLASCSAATRQVMIWDFTGDGLVLAACSEPTEDGGVFPAGLSQPVSIAVHDGLCVLAQGPDRAELRFFDTAEPGSGLLTWPGSYDAGRAETRRFWGAQAGQSYAFGYPGHVDVVYTASAGRLRLAGTRLTQTTPADLDVVTAALELFDPDNLWRLRRHALYACLEHRFADGTAASRATAC